MQNKYNSECLPVMVGVAVEDGTPVVKLDTVLAPVVVEPEVAPDTVVPPVT